MKHRTRYLTLLLTILLLTTTACKALVSPEPDGEERLDPIVAEAKTVVGGQEYTVQLIQTMYEYAPTSEEEGFRLYIQYKGMFDLVALNAGGEEVSRLSGQDFFQGDTPMGFPQGIPIVFQDYNGDGNPDFVISCPAVDSSCHKCAILSLDADGQLSQLRCEGFWWPGFAYGGSTDGSFIESFPLLEGDESGFKTWIYWDIRGKYVWDGAMFRFALDSPDA